MRKGHDGKKNGKKNGENSGPLTSLPVDRLTATVCNSDRACFKKVEIGGNYYGLAPYSATNALDKSEKEELKKLRRGLRLPPCRGTLTLLKGNQGGPLMPSYGGQSRNNDWSKLTGAEKQAMTCRDW